MKWYRLFAVCLVLCCLGEMTLGAELNPKRKREKVEIPKTQHREMRAAWIATIFNIDWPSKSGLSVEEMKQELEQTIDNLYRMNFNAVVLQVRTEAEVLYSSPYEPWTRFLTGSTGTAPAQSFDPLQFAIEQCHRRGMELHAWFNPYRVSNNVFSALSPDHPYNKNPDWFFSYGGKTYMEPGHPDVRNWITDVVVDVVRRYDIDAVHFDDYFYPYPKNGEKINDYTIFRQYNRGYAIGDKDDWRRDNVDLIIQQLSASIKRTKPWVKFGISPFGVWRNKRDDSRGSEGGASLTNYDGLYADVLKWTTNGWIDYVAPQIYWNIGYKIADYSVLIKWWADNVKTRDIYIGHALHKVDAHSKSAAWSSEDEIPNQIDLIRKTDGVNGSIFYSAKHFNRNLLGLQGKLATDLYYRPVLTPAMPWIDSTPPLAPENVIGITEDAQKLLQWDRVDGDDMNRAVKYVIYRYNHRSNLKRALKSGVLDSNDIFLITTATSYSISRQFLESIGESYKSKSYYIVTAVDRISNESWCSGYVKF